MNTKFIKILTFISMTTFLSSYCMEQEQHQLKANKKLIKAAATGNLEKLQDAIKEGADVYYVGKYKYDKSNSIIGPAIFQACHIGHLHIVKFLIESAGVSVNATLPNNHDTIHNTIFKTALNNSKFDIVEYLIEKGANTNPINYLHYDLDQIKFLVWHGIYHNPNGDNIKHFIDVINKTLTLLKLAKLSSTISYTTLNKEIDNILSLDIQKNEKIINFFKKIEKIQNKSLKEIVQKVNKILRLKIHETKICPKDLINLVGDYYIYPENYKDFFALSDQEIDEIIEIYIKNSKENSQPDLTQFIILPLSYN